MEKKIFVLILCTMILVVGCSKKSSTDEKPGESQPTESQPAETEVQEQVEETTVDVQEKKKELVPADISSNDTAVYIGADTVVEVEMGAFDGSSQKTLCKVKMPTNYYIASLYMDETGQSQTMLETKGKLLSEVVETGALEACSQVPATVVMTAQGGADNSYSFVIVDTGTISVASEKDYAPGGIDIASGSDHEAYVYSTSGQFDVVLVYQINENWSLLIENSGELKKQMALDQIGQEFYDLVTPID